MAQIENLSPKILHWEGGFVNDTTDRGGATNMGVTLSTWQAVGYDKDGDGDIDADDMKRLNEKDFIVVLRKYWDRWRADEIKSQPVANILVDWVWGSGKWGIVIPQRILGLTQDGIVGPKTIEAVNSQDPKDFYYKIFHARLDFLNNIAQHDPSQQKFIHGWLNRLNDFQFQN